MSGVPVRPLTPMLYWPKLWSCTRGPVEQSERSATKPVAPTIAVELFACISFCTSKTYRCSVVMLLEKNFQWHHVVTVALHSQTENHPKKKVLWILVLFPELWSLCLAGFRYAMQGSGHIHCIEDLQVILGNDRLPNQMGNGTMTYPQHLDKAAKSKYNRAIWPYSK